MAENCLGCRGGSVHHTCGRTPDASMAEETRRPDPRMPDPTLCGLDGVVTFDDTDPQDPPIAHRYRVPCEADVLEMDQCHFPSSHACWFAVPCREEGCFPDAPPPGHLHQDAELYGSPYREFYGLAWQLGETR